MEINKTDTLLKYFTLLSPWFVLVFTKIFIGISNSLLSPAISWIPAFLGYYLGICLIIFIADHLFSICSIKKKAFSFKPYPNFKLLFFGAVFPALLPLGVILFKYEYIPTHFFIYILLFSLINPFFEEAFWRGFLIHLPMNNLFKILYSAALFAFAHYFLWGFWSRDGFITLTTVLSTFVMGICWMWFMIKRQNLLYPIISHVMVDIFNLSVAIYVGIVPL